METVSWFFFDLLFLGYVEDSHSGESFQLPGGLSWSIYIEVSIPCPSMEWRIWIQSEISVWWGVGL